MKIKNRFRGIRSIHLHATYDRYRSTYQTHRVKFFNDFSKFVGTTSWNTTPTDWEAVGVAAPNFVLSKEGDLTIHSWKGYWNETVHRYETKAVYRETLANYNLGELIHLSQTQPRLLYYHGSSTNYYSVSPQNTHACFNHGTFTDLISFLDTIEPQNIEKTK